MATDSIESPSDHQLVEDEKRKRKREIDKKSREKNKQKQENTEVQLKTFQEKCTYYQAQADFCEKSLLKHFLDGTNQFKKLYQELGEIKGHIRDNVEKETDLVEKIWDLIKKQLPGERACGSISASTDEDTYPPLELSVTAIKSDGSIKTESFKQCQSLPEEWARLAMGERERLIRAFFGLREHYTATTARHAREIAERDQELANLREELARAQAMPYSNLFEDNEPPRL